MNNLGDYFNKFQKIFSGAKFQKDTILSVIKSAAKIELDPKEMDVKDYTIKLNTSMAVKSAVFIKKQKILEELKKVMGDKAPTDIR